MAGIVTGSAQIRYDRLSLIPLGGQSEVGQVLWILSWGGELILIDAGAAYPAEDLPGVDLILPNTNFLEANQERILALLLTNGHEEHSGGVAYLLNHLAIPRIMGPRFVATLTAQQLMNKGHNTTIDTIEIRHPYQIGPFEVEWIQVNDAIADACALRIGTPEGVIVYTSSFKFDQTPVDKRLTDIARLTQIGEALLLISDSAGVEHHGYTPSEKSVVGNFTKQIVEATGRVIVVLPGTNTHRLQILFDLAQSLKRKVILFGETLIQTALVAAVTGNLVYDRKIEASHEDLPALQDHEVLVIATGHEGDPFNILEELAYNKNPELLARESDTIIYSADVAPGRLRRLAMIQDQLLCLGVKALFGAKNGVHVSKHAAQEELKLMLSIIKPRFFIPGLAEGRHIMHHAQLAYEWGMTPESVFPLKNGEILEIGNGGAHVAGEIESQAVLYNRDQGERVTTFSVNERKTLSLEGILTVGCVVDSSLTLISGPTIEGGASGFLQSSDWLNTKQELCVAIAQFVAGFRDAGKQDIGALRVAIREMVSKTLKLQLQAKPSIQVMIHQLSTSLPE
ncbi:MAG: ribonuclease J [Candidatus Melainabacteria bacterium]|nr:ribonuclease J [Candidatus Melainabacteria bacterium]